MGPDEESAEIAKTKNRPFLERVRYALAGVATAFRSENSFRIHAAASVAVLVALVWLRPQPVWWAVVALATMSVLALELVNTAIEKLADRLHPEEHADIKAAKDCAAAAVLVASCGALIVAAALVFELTA